jgi:predicted TIM-barrel fold metal-dependent hydrolase
LPAAVIVKAPSFLKSLQLVPEHRYAPDYDATLDDYLALLKSNGMTHGVLVQPSFLGTDNSFMISALKSYPDKLRGVAVIDPVKDRNKLDDMRKAGCVGIRRMSLASPTRTSGARVGRLLLASYAIWAGWLKFRPKHPASVLRHIVEPLLNTGVNIVIDHFGRPDPQLGIADPGVSIFIVSGRFPACMDQNIWSLPKRQEWHGRTDRVGGNPASEVIVRLGTSRLGQRLAAYTV